MAVVHLARQTDLDRLVALKELNALEAEESSYARRFVREARLAGSLSHSNIVHVYDYFEHDGTPFIAMEYVARGSLRRYVEHMTLAQIAGVLEGILAALSYAEQLEIVHRDLKPENVLVGPDGHIKLADFGIAKALNQVPTSALMTATGMTVGTPAYMAPEQAMAADVGPWTDLYAVGCMAYEFVAGCIPFSDADNPMALLLRRINEPIPSIRTVRSDCSPELSDWIDRLLVREPAQRTRSAAIALDELEDIVIGVIGPRWRRAAPLADPAVASEPAAGAPPPPGFAPAGADDRESGFAQTERPSTGTVTPPPAGGVGGPYTPPPAELVAGMDTPPAEAAVPDALPGPYTPPPENAIVPDELADAEFITFGPTADEPPPLGMSGVLRVGPHEVGTGEPPVEKPAEGPETAADSAAALTGRSFDAAASETAGYRTFVPPPPSRPPIDEPAADRPAPRPAAPAPEPPQPSAPELRATLPPREPVVAPPAPPGAGDRPAPRRSRAALAVVGAAAAAVIAGVVLVPGGGEPKRSGRQTPAVAPGVALQVDALRAQTPAGWKPVAQSITVPGLEGSRAAAPGGGAEAGAVTLGLAPWRATTQSLLPKPLVAALERPGGTVPKPERVTVGRGLAAYRYEGLEPRELGRPLTVYAVPTSRGVATLACVGPSARDAEFADRCAEVAASLSVDGVRTYPPGPSRSYARAVDAALRNLNDASNRGHRALRESETPRGQAAAAGSIAEAHRRAARALEARTLSPADRPDNAALAEALRATGKRYEQLGSAAKRASSGRYRAAARRAEHAQAGVKRARDRLAAHGYDGLLRAEYALQPVPPLARPRPSPAPTAQPTPAPTPAPTVAPQPTVAPRPTVGPKPTVIPD